MLSNIEYTNVNTEVIMYNLVYSSSKKGKLCLIKKYMATLAKIVIFIESKLLLQNIAPSDQ